MNALVAADVLGLGLVGWLVALAVGFVVGGVYFLTMKLEVEYVVEKRGPTWVLPAALYARLVLLAAVLIVVALNVPRKQLPAAVIAGLVGAMAARVCVARAVRRRSDKPKPPDTEEHDDGVLD